ncbi:MAG: hypothetical protein RLZ50_943, partial [Bacteroidota bacterium]
IHIIYILHLLLADINPHFDATKIREVWLFIGL